MLEAELNKMWNNLQAIRCLGDFEVGGERLYSEEALSFFARIISHLSVQPLILPVRDRDTLLIEYHGGKGSLVFVLRNGWVEKMYTSNDDPRVTRSEIIESDFIEQINRCVRLFYGIYDD